MDWDQADDDQYGSWYAESLLLEKLQLEKDREKMGIVLTKAPGGAEGFEPAPAGAHLGRLIKVIDLGTQEVQWQGKVSRRPQIYLQWELPSALMDSGHPFVIGKRYTRSMHKKATLRGMLEGWRGKSFTDAEIDAGFSLAVLLGKPCMITVTHNENDDRVYANVGGVSPVPAGIPVPPHKNELVEISLDEEFSEDQFMKLSEKMRATIAKSPEYAALAGVPMPEDDEIPF